MTPIRPRRSVAAVAAASFCVLLSLLLPSLVLGHAELASMSPADKASVPPPTELVASFTENLDISASSLTLVDGSNAVLTKGGAVDAADPKTMRLPLTGITLAPGGYTIRWTSKSAADGDIARGTTSFSVVAATSAPTAPAVSSASATAAASASPESTASVAPSPSASGGTGATTSSSDALIPIIVVLAAVIVVGLWLLRGRSRRTS
jgi:methionine-rich copper-binding protein CopC